jgi:hypothetical protein
MTYLRGFTETLAGMAYRSSHPDEDFWGLRGSYSPLRIARLFQQNKHPSEKGCLREIAERSAPMNNSSGAIPVSPLQRTDGIAESSTTAL